MLNTNLKCFVILFALFILSYCQNEKPNATDWVRTPKREGLAKWLLRESLLRNTTEYEYEGYDGFYNNLARPELGAIDTPLLRRSPAAYSDGTYKPAGEGRPNPLNLSELLLKGDITEKSNIGRNALLVFFGQQVVEEILDAQRAACPPEYFNIPIPEKHSYRNTTDHTMMPLLRTRYDASTGYSPNNPRQQLNEITPYIDGGLIYGTTKLWADQLRMNNSKLAPFGLLATSHNGLFPAYNEERLPMANPPPPTLHHKFVHRHEILPVKRFFKLGNPRGNENTFLLTFGVLWFRWHNYLAENLKKQHSTWSDEKIYNEARKWVIASQQQIIMYEWLPSWLDDQIPSYKGYNPSVDPQIDQFFQAAAFRFGHTLVPSAVYLRDYNREGCNYKQVGNWTRKIVRTCNAFWRPQDAITANYKDTELIDIDRILMGMSTQLSEKEDHMIVEDLRGNVFGPLEFPRRDLMAINVQRGRDHGLPDFNTAREAYNLTKYGSFDEFTEISDDTRKTLKELYKDDINNIDVWIGGILETTPNGPGPLFRAVIKDQFTRIRDGDRFWFENLNNKLFSMADIQLIKQLKLYDIILAVTKMAPEDIPKNPLRVPTSGTEIGTNCTSQLIEGSCRNYTDNNTKIDCFHLPNLNLTTINEPCTTCDNYSSSCSYDNKDTYDYFTYSEVSFIVTFSCLVAILIGTYSGIYFISNKKQTEIIEKSKQLEQKVRQSFKAQKNATKMGEVYSAHEWIGHKISNRPVILTFDESHRQINVMTQRGDLLRVKDLSPEEAKLTIYACTDRSHLLLKTGFDYDLLIKFESEFLRNNFVRALEIFITNIGRQRENMNNFSLNAILNITVTKESRQKRLEMFFRVVFAQAFNIDYSNNIEVLNVDAKVVRDVIHTELTLNEFADALSMQPKSEFVKKMFLFIDKDKNGFVSFREFVDLLIIFADGDENKKAKLLFDMYDINATGELTRQDFLDMLKSFMETVEATVEQQDLDNVVKNMINTAMLADKHTFNLEDFKKIIGNDISKLNQAHLNVPGQTSISTQQRNYIESAKDAIEQIYESPEDIRERLAGNGPTESTKPISTIIDEEQKVNIEENINRKPIKYLAFIRTIEKNSKVLFWYTLYTLVLIAIFAERAYYYSVEREHSGLRRIAGYGVTVTRGAASAMMFTYSSLLVTMCRNIITYLRDTVANNYFPFDSSVEFHKYIACWALFFSVVHIVGHGINFYHISSQTADDVTCLFRNYFRSTHEIPKFHYWCWQTLTGFTGIVLTLIGIVMFIFAQKFVRRRLYNWFWYTHALYPLFFIFMVLHGAGRLIQEPFFYYFFLGPVILYLIDFLVSASRNRIEIPVLKAEILPSGVTMLEFKRPTTFEYKSGQWIRIACLKLNGSEYHPFTLSSSPDEPNLTVHIRAVGPWTRNIRQLYDNTLLREEQLPKIYLDGPYGEGHQDWYRYNVSVLIGGGIGVTPFASILKDIVYRSNSIHKQQCQKVYFIWVSRTQKQFEWFIDIIRELEKSDTKRIVSCHIFITQFYQKFDIRTVLLYICERHYQRISDKSLFTNLKAATHFGRPNFAQFFKSIQHLHLKEVKVGVFSCGPPSMTASIEDACVRLNKETHQGAIFDHHFKNF